MMFYHTPFQLTFLVLFSHIVSLWHNALANILISPNDLSSTVYDFIIVGGGTAGNVLARRLTENPASKVLVIEAGVSNQGVLDIIVPFLGVTAPKTIVDWNYTTSLQRGLNNRSIPFARGHVLGGSSSINLMAWTRGSNDVWDNWAKITEDRDWSWKSIEPYYLKTSHLVQPADGHNTTGQVNPAVHGSGPVEISLPGFQTELDERVINSSKLLGGEFFFNEDLNAGEMRGFAYMQSTIGEGQRSSSATAYLDPIINRTNLDILIMTHVTKLIPSEAQSHALPEFLTVEIASDATGPRRQIKASKEVILSGGVVGSPQLLLLSGIGPKEELSRKNIKTIVDLPDVGKHLADHPLLPNYFIVNSKNTFDDVIRNETLLEQDLQQWTVSKQGLFVDSPGNTLGFMRLPNNSDIFKTVAKDPSSGPLSAHTELLFVDGFAPLAAIEQPATGNFISILSALVSPTSRGSITLRSSDPFADPIIDLGILSTEFDILTMVQVMKDAARFIQTAPWAGFVVGPFGDLANATTDEKKATFIRDNAVTVNHPVGTARMSPSHANWGVTDSHLLVKGTRGLRIVDASIFPLIPECHTQAIVYTVAERAADLIKSAHGLHL